MSGGSLEGTWLNREDPYATQYILGTEAGQVRIAREQVAEHRRIAPARDEYEQLAPTFGNSIEEQLELAEWCHQHSLPEQREHHLERVLEIDTNHPAARATLGYTYIDGRWVLPRRFHEESGLVQHEGEWQLQQAIDLTEQRRGEAEIAREWLAQVRRWRDSIVEDGDTDARDALLATTDPHLVAAIASAYVEEPCWPMRSLYVEALYQVSAAGDLNFASVDFLVRVATEEPHVEVRFAAVEALERLDTPAALDPLIKALDSNDNAVVNRAAIALGRLEDGSAIEPLIARLVTTHQYVIEGSDATVGSFGRAAGNGAAAPAAFTSGRGDQIITQTLRNQEVLRALARLSGVSYGFDVDTWNTWLETQKAASSTTIQSRRSE